MQKEQLLPQLLTNHYVQKDTLIDCTEVREGEEKGGEAVDALLLHNFNFNLKVSGTVKPF